VLEVATTLVVGLAIAAGVASLAVKARRQSPRIDPFAVAEPWRQFVQEALQARARFRHTIEITNPGPLRDRLEDIGRRVDAAVDECWRVAKHGHLLDRALRSLRVDAVRKQLDVDHHDATTAESLRAQLESAERMTSVATGARERLRLLDARLGETVARATELSLQAGEQPDIGTLGTDVEAVVIEMEALRQALEDVGNVSGGP